MPMSPSSAADLVRELRDSWEKNYDDMSMVNRWYRGTLDEGKDMPSMPTQKTREFKELRDRSITNWLKLAVTVVAQSLFVEGYRHANDSENTAAWLAWQMNRMDGRQNAIHRGALALGQAYGSAVPGRSPIDGSRMPVIKGHSARSMLAWYDDPTVDEWPLYALEGKKINASDGTQQWRFRLWDDEATYIVDGDTAGGVKYVSHDMHGGGVCPIVRYTNDLDLDGNSDGEVQPNIDLAARINQDTFDRMVVQRFQAWLVRTISGMTLPDEDEQAAREKLRLSVEDILVAEDPDTKFSSLPQAQLDGLIKARDADIRDFAVVTQTPPHDLLGAMINLSADALAAAEASKMRKVAERQHTFGESHEQLLRYCGYLMDDTDAAMDFSAQVVWADTESRSLAQVADAFGKIVQMLGVPPEGLWHRIPGFTAQDVEEWKALAAEGGSLERLMAELANGQTSPPGVDDGSFS